MPYDTDLRAGCRAILRAAAVLPDAQIQWERTPFQPVQGQQWCRENLISANRRLVSFSATGGLQKIDHIYQLTWFDTAGHGMKDVEALAGAAAAAFKPGTSVTAGSVNAVVEQADVAPPVEEKEWVGIPVSIRLYAHVANN